MFCFVLAHPVVGFYFGQNLVDKTNESFGSRLIIQFARQKHLTKNRRKMKKKEKIERKKKERKRFEKNKFYEVDCLLVR